MRIPVKKRVLLRTLSLIAACLVLVAGLPSVKTLSPVFFHTENSDEWITHLIHIQREYSRVLVVDGSTSPRRRLTVPSLNLNSRMNVDGPERDYPIFASFKTLQEAADTAQGGDLVAVMPGHYAGFVLEEKPSAGDQRYIHFKAMGEP